MAIEEVGGEEEQGEDANCHTWEEEVVVMEVADMEEGMDTVEEGAVEGTVVMVVVVVAMEVVATRHHMITRLLFITSKSTECCNVN